MSFYQLHPRATIHERHNGDLQLGTDPRTAVIVRGLNRDTLRKIDGHHDVAQLAALSNSPAEEIADLLSTLASAGLVVEQKSHAALPHLATHDRRAILRESAPTEITQRLETVIYVHGLNRLGVLTASLLREAGFPHLRFVDDRNVTPNDVQVWGFSRIDIGQRRDRTLALIHESLAQGNLHKQIHPPVTVPAELHVVIADQQCDWPVLNPRLVNHFVSSGVDHLMAAYGDSQSLISPVITPETHGCIQCQFHSLVDRDASWPLIFDNVIHQDVSDRAPIGLLIDTAIEIVQRVSHHFGNTQDETLLVLNWPARQHSYENWIAHPACGCQWDEMS